MSKDGTCLQAFPSLPWSGYYVLAILAEVGPRSDHSGTFEVWLCSLEYLHDYEHIIRIHTDKKPEPVTIASDVQYYCWKVTIRKDLY